MAHRTMVFKTTAFCVLTLSTLQLYSAEFPKKVLTQAASADAFEALTEQQQRDAKLIAFGAMYGRLVISDRGEMLQESSAGAPSSELALTSDSALLRFLASDMGFYNLVSSLEKKIEDEAKKREAAQEATKEAEKKALLIAASRKNFENSFTRCFGIELDQLGAIDAMGVDQKDEFFKTLTEKRMASTTEEKFKQSLTDHMNAFVDYLNLTATREERDKVGASIYLVMGLEYAKTHTKEETLAFMKLPGSN